MGIFSRSEKAGSGSSSRTSASPAPSSGSSARLNPQPIPTVNLSNRHNVYYAGEPADMGTPEFTRKHSFYSTKTHRQPDYMYFEASDVRRQVREAPSHQGAVGPYPRKYHNNPPAPLTADPPFREYPIVPRREGGPTRFTAGMKPGPVRAFYNNDDRSRFDVGYHDPTRAPLAPRNGNEHPNTPYSLATYHPGPTYTDTATYRDRR